MLHPVPHVAQPILDGPVSVDTDVFHFVRVRYESSGGYGESWYHFEGRNWQRWETDYPRGELNLLIRLNELTSLRVNPEPIVLRLTDDALFDYPFIFMSDVGWQVLSRAERVRLKQYLDRGGFLWVDDFWGNAEWANFQRNMKGVAPNWSWQAIPAGHPILNAVYPMKQCPQIPARIFFETRGMMYDPHWVHRQPAGDDAGVSTVHLIGLFNERGRMVAIATHNTDIADGWEREGEDREYFERFSINSYAIAINILFYAFTH
jgi:hypothetical protein